MSMMLTRNRKIAFSGLLISCGIIFGYVEFLFPLPIGIPGVKLGLSNVITLICMYTLDPLVTFAILFMRVVLSGVLFGNLFGTIYGIAGAICSYLLMMALKRMNAFSVIGISAFGGVIHNIAQLLIAVFLVNEMKLSFYLPVLIISGLVCGILVGIISGIMLPRIYKFIEYSGEI